jgi:hypothetical protein
LRLYTVYEIQKFSTQIQFVDWYNNNKTPEATEEIYGLVGVSRTMGYTKAKKFWQYQHDRGHEKKD